MPEYFIRNHFNRPPDQIFSKVGFSGDHSKTIALVQSGSYQVGAVNFKVWKKELAAGKIDPSKEKLHTRVGELSGGQQQRVGIGRAFYRGGSVLMADEPVSSLGRVQQEQIMAIITRTDKTVVSTLHAIDLSRQFFNRIVGLKDRCILFDLPVQEVSDTLLETLYA